MWSSRKDERLASESSSLSIVLERLMEDKRLENQRQELEARNPREDLSIVGDSSVIVYFFSVIFAGGFLAGGFLWLGCGLLYSGKRFWGWGVMVCVVLSFLSVLESLGVGCGDKGSDNSKSRRIIRISQPFYTPASAGVLYGGGRRQIGKWPSRITQAPAVLARSRCGQRSQQPSRESCEATCGRAQSYTSSTRASRQRSGFPTSY